jgi:hypothetical protein
MYDALVDGFPILASRGLDPRKEYFCARCSERVALKIGLYVAPHFAHYPCTLCSRRGGGESREHAALKVLLYDFLRREVERGRIRDLRIEAPFGEMVADLGFTTAKGLQVAIEITVNNLNLDHTQAKIKAYRRMRVRPLWLFAHSVLKPKARRVLTLEKLNTAMETDAADWVELEGLYRPPRVLVYLHSFLGCAFLVLPSGLPAVIRLVKPEVRPANGRPQYRVQVLPKACYPLRLDLLIYRYAGPKFPAPARTPMAALVPQLSDFRPELFDGNAERNYSPRTVLVSKWTGIRFKYPVLENAHSQSTYNV